jgi:hypothetical protein
MARTSTISIEQVAEAANRIQALGVTPTTRNVREVVGGGSMGTILKHFQQWQSGIVQTKPVISETLDPSIIQIINSYIAEQVQESRADLTAQLAEKESDANMLLKEYEQLTAEMAMQTNVLSALQLQYAELNGRFQQQEIESEKLFADLLNERQSSENLKVALGIAGRQLEEIPRYEKVIAQLSDERKNAIDRAVMAEAKLEAELSHRKIS